MLMWKCFKRITAELKHKFVTSCQIEKGTNLVKIARTCFNANQNWQPHV